jgi:hypothetical protein
MACRIAAPQPLLPGGVGLLFGRLALGDRLTDGRLGLLDALVHLLQLRAYAVELLLHRGGVLLGGLTLGHELARGRLGLFFLLASGLRLLARAGGVALGRLALGHQLAHGGLGLLGTVVQLVVVRTGAFELLLKRRDVLLGGLALGEHLPRGGLRLLCQAAVALDLLPGRGRLLLGLLVLGLDGRDLRRRLLLGLGDLLLALRQRAGEHVGHLSQPLDDLTRLIHARASIRPGAVLGQP